MKMKMTELIGKRKTLEKARKEHHSFVSVRTIKDINSNVELLKTALRLEKNLVNAHNAVTQAVDSFK